jgi:hypothetical protein
LQQQHLEPLQPVVDGLEVISSEPRPLGGDVEQEGFDLRDISVQRVPIISTAIGNK